MNWFWLIIKKISVFRCKKNNVPIEKIYNKTQRDKFQWAIDMAGQEYEFWNKFIENRDGWHRFVLI